MKQKLSYYCEGITDGSHNPPQSGDVSDYLMISSKNIFDDNITLDAPRFLSKEQFLIENKRTNIKPGDVLMTIVGTVGRSAVVNSSLGKITLQRSVAVLHPNRDICNSRFLMYALISKRSFFEREAHGVAQKGIYLKQLSDIELDFPDLEQQLLIINKLDRINQIIYKRKEQLEFLDAIIKARFVEMFGDNMENKRNFPIESLDVHANIVSGITKGRKTKELNLTEVPYMAVSNVKDGYIDWTTVKTILATSSEIEQYRLQTNDVLMTEGGDPDKLGRGALLTTVPENCIHQNHIFRVRLDSRVNPVYFEEYLQTARPKRYFLKAAKQTTGIASINMTQLRHMPLILPPMEEQKEFADFVHRVDKSKVVVQKALDETQTLFDSLMQEYFG